MNVPRRQVLKVGGLALASLGTASIFGVDKALASTPVSAALSPPAGTPQDSKSQVMLLSGTSKDDTVDWDFMCTTGSNSGTWSTIAVPSNWELQGFGNYSYRALSPGEQGLYKHSFTPPSAWQAKRIFLVFEGSMTDTEVWVNRASAGPVHQGGFYRFGYEVTDLVRLGESNLLEVTVTKDSANSSVNGAERLADFWEFGGIFRPVYLEARPAQFIDRVAVNAQADGSFAADIYLNGITTAGTLIAQISGPVDAGDSAHPKPVGSPFSVAVSPGLGKATLATAVQSPDLWTAETPNLYDLEVRLVQDGVETHRVTQRFGFRTVELRAGDGIYVNGTKVILRGIGRHTFWPDSGRTTSPEVSRSDILLMKEMNVNAVRMTHYPPDQHFLEYADALGIYVLDELTGWQHAYDTPTGTKLVEEMVVRDVNHPSIIFWINGNEGGSNPDLDALFGVYDPQQRQVFHAGRNFGGIIDRHYPTYSQTASTLAGSTVYLPTEFLHALYDGGGGAGLDDHWTLMMSSPLGAGGFIWDLIDEGVVRTDLNGIIDSAGNLDADGVTGPYRQKEGSFYAVKDVWSPIQIADPAYFETVFPAGFDGKVEIINNYSFTATAKCRFSWKLINFHDPSHSHAGHTVVRFADATPSRSRANAAPGSTDVLDLRLPRGWQHFDALSLTALDPSGQQINSWTWPIKKAIDYKNRIVTAGGGTTTASESATAITMTAAQTQVDISKATGTLAAVTCGHTTIPLANGPILATGSGALTDIAHHQDGNAHVVEATYTGDLNTCRWTLLPSGWLQLDYHYNLTGNDDYLGVNFDFPEDLVTGITWLGDGPFRVYKNRMRGVTMDVWSKAYNDTATGADTWEYPEFKGYHADIKWASLETRAGRITVVAEDDNLFLRLFTPRNGPNPLSATAPYPGGDISFLDAIAPMGNKFQTAALTGPQGAQNVATGDYRRTILFSFDAM